MNTASIYAVWPKASIIIYKKHGEL
jgi:hypothetical protein